MTMSDAPLVFLDLETTGLDPERDQIWEFAAIRSYQGTETAYHFFVQHDMSLADSHLPEIFLNQYKRRFHAQDSNIPTIDPTALAAIVRHIVFAPVGGVKPHIVGAVPSFDENFLKVLLIAHGYGSSKGWPWHYHLIDVENLTVGYLNGMLQYGSESKINTLVIQNAISLPWNADELSSTLGIDLTRYERHTAMGDVQWARAIYQRVMP